MAAARTAGGRRRAGGLRVPLGVRGEQAMSWRAPEARSEGRARRPTARSNKVSRQAGASWEWAVWSPEERLELGGGAGAWVCLGLGLCA